MLYICRSLCQRHRSHSADRQLVDSVKQMILGREREREERVFSLDF